MSFLLSANIGYYALDMVLGAEDVLMNLKLIHSFLSFFIHSVTVYRISAM